MLRNIDIITFLLSKKAQKPHESYFYMYQDKKKRAHARLKTPIFFNKKMGFF